MRTSVTRQASSAAKTLVAYVASRLLVGVRGKVFVQFLPSPEATIAEIAAMRQGLQMIEPVHVQGRLLLERVTAGFAHVRPFASMCAPVFIERRF